MVPADEPGPPPPVPPPSSETTKTAQVLPVFPGAGVRPPAAAPTPPPPAEPPAWQLAAPVVTPTGPPGPPAPSATGLSPDVLRHAEWFVWAKKAGGTVTASHQAARAAIDTLGAGGDEKAARAAAMKALRGGTPAVAIEALDQKYSGWFTMANVDYRLDLQRSHVFAEAGVRAQDEGKDLPAAILVAEQASSGPTSATAPVAGGPTGAPPSQLRTPLLIGLAAILVLTVAGGGGWILLKGSNKAAPVSKSQATATLRAGDLPADLKSCAESGEIGSYLKSVQTTNPDSYKSLDGDWTQWQQKGAQQGWIAVYTNLPTECTHLTGATNVDPSAKYASSVAYGFKDAAAAAALWQKDFTSTSGFISGTATGLGPHSYTGTPFGPLWQVAGFQSGRYVIFFDLINLSPAEGTTATGNIYKRTASG